MSKIRQYYMLKTQKKGAKQMAYQIPRNVKGEGRILFIFSKKALITTAIGGGIRNFLLVGTKHDRITGQ